ncbi:MAG TPA: hypothetical protein PKA39_04420, partial [Ignavibacteria bacterium]|nr:hypothetical protein [Ignavibacteria bacterium]
PRRKLNLRILVLRFFHDQEVVPRCGITPTKKNSECIILSFFMTRRSSRDAGSPRQKLSLRILVLRFFYDQEAVTRCGITPTDIKPQNA